jgi:retron-type reverse transcriptase
MTQCVNWVLDADIRKFFDSVDHEWSLADDRAPDRRSTSSAVIIRMWLKTVLQGLRHSREFTRLCFPKLTQAF